MEEQNNGLFELNSKTKYLCDSVTEIINRATLFKSYRLSEQCIYRIPPKIRQLNEAAYTPRIVSIGPFHYKSHERLEPMQRFKQGYLKAFVDRTGLNLEDCFNKLQELEISIRLCYGMSIDPKIEQISSDEFLKMIPIDACFIIEHFIRFDKLNEWGERDPLFLKPWLIENVILDLILLENQLPLFVLRDIFELATGNASPSFLEITFKYFKSFNKQDLKPADAKNVPHFTDLLRKFNLPWKTTKEIKTERDNGSSI